MKNNVIDFVAWNQARNKKHWRTMSATTRHKSLSAKDALEYIAFAVWHRDLPDEFDGEITCEMNDDGSVEVYAVDKIDESDEPLN